MVLISSFSDSCLVDCKRRRVYSGWYWSVLHTVVPFLVPWAHLFQVAKPAALLAEVDYVIPYLLFSEAGQIIACADTGDVVSLSNLCTGSETDLLLWNLRFLFTQQSKKYAVTVAIPVLRSCDRSCHVKHCTREKMQWQGWKETKKKKKWAECCLLKLFRTAWVESREWSGNKSVVIFSWHWGPMNTV